MVLHSRKNEYVGVNAHLHSFYQTNGGWETFHSVHIAHIAEALNALLPPEYTVGAEESLQIREFNTETGLPTMRRPKPDITIYGPASPGYAPTTEGLDATLTYDLVDTLDPEIDQQFLSAVIIYEVENDTLGKAITRIELLSPVNKTSAYFSYAEKRAAALRSEVCLVEIDYLHQTPSPLRKIPSYLRRQPKSSAYYVAVSIPRPSLNEGKVIAYPFSVDMHIPLVEIPLSGDERITLDLNPIYDRTFSATSNHSRRVDYAELPLNFDTYSPADQERIRQRMAKVAAENEAQ